MPNIRHGVTRSAPTTPSDYHPAMPSPSAVVAHGRAKEQATALGGTVKEGENDGSILGSMGLKDCFGLCAGPDAPVGGN